MPRRTSFKVSLNLPFGLGGVEQPKGDGSASFGTLAITVLNDALRPLLATWHPLLQDHEDQRPPEVTRVDWEQSWERIDELSAALAEVRQTVSQYARLLAEVADVPALTDWDGL